MILFGKAIPCSRGLTKAFYILMAVMGVLAISDGNAEQFGAAQASYDRVKGGADVEISSQ